MSRKDSKNRKARRKAADRARKILAGEKSLIAAFNRARKDGQVFGETLLILAYYDTHLWKLADAAEREPHPEKDGPFTLDADERCMIEEVVARQLADTRSMTAKRRIANDRAEEAAKAKLAVA